jgi:hypothetical protein
MARELFLQQKVLYGVERASKYYPLSMSKETVFELAKKDYIADLERMIEITKNLEIYNFK